MLPKNFCNGVNFKVQRKYNFLSMALSSCCREMMLVKKLECFLKDSFKLFAILRHHFDNLMQKIAI